MSYIFNFIYKPDTELIILNNFVKEKKLKWKSRNILLNGDIDVIFTSSVFDINENLNNLKRLESSGIIINTIQYDNGKYIIHNIV
jgi:hypothetical protein